MTKKDYIAIARVFNEVVWKVKSAKENSQKHGSAEYSADQAIDMLLHGLEHELYIDNPNFNSDKFYEAIYKEVE